MSVIKCSKCGSDKVIPQARIVDRGDNNSTYRDLTVAIARDPNAIFFKENTYGTLSARICAVCGFSELYCDNLDELWAAYVDVSGGS